MRRRIDFWKGSMGDPLAALYRNESLDPQKFRRNTDPDELARLIAETYPEQFGRGDEQAIARLAAELRQEQSGIVSAGEIVTKFPTQRPDVIEGWLREREIMNAVAAPKARKTWWAIALSIEVAVGGMFLNRFSTSQGRVLYIDNECPPEVIADRIRRVADAKGYKSGWQENLHIRSLRGSLRNINEMQSFFNGLEPNQYRLIVIDALYRMLPPDTENDNSGMAQIYNTIDRYAQSTNSAFLLIHHVSKGIQSGKSVTDTGAGAGAQSRAADVHLTLRDHEEEDCCVMEAAMRSQKPIEPLGLRWQFPLWQIDPSIDVTLLKRERGRGGRPRKAEAAPESESGPTVRTPAEFTASFVTESPRPKDVIIALAVQAGYGQSEAKRLLTISEQYGIAHRHKIKSDNKTYYATKEQLPLEAEAARKR